MWTSVCGQPKRCGLEVLSGNIKEMLLSRQSNFDTLRW